MEEHDLVDRWLAWLEHNKGRSAKTSQKYRQYLYLLIGELKEAGTTLLDAKPSDLEAFAGLRCHERGIKPRSRRPIVGAIRGFYRWLTHTGQIDLDPARWLPYPKAGHPLPVGMTLANAEKLLMAPGLDTFIGVRDTAILALFIGCGLRLGGLAALNEEDLFWTRHEETDWLVVRVREKGGKSRMVPAPHEARLLMRAYLGHEALKPIDRTVPDGGNVLFVSTNRRDLPEYYYYGEARRLSTRSIAEAIERYGLSVGIPRDQLHPHALRHLYGTELVEDDVNLLKVQALMGHKDPSSTEVYTHLAMRSLAKAVEQANPLGKMSTPVSSLVNMLRTSGQRKRLE